MRRSRGGDVSLHEVRALLRASSNDVKTVVMCTTKNRPGMPASLLRYADSVTAARVPAWIEAGMGLLPWSPLPEQQ